MENWNIAATKQTPAIEFNAAVQTLTMMGESYPENISELSTPLFQWLNHYLADPESKKLQLDIELTYFNSSSSKMLLDLFAHLETEVQENQRDIVINWIYTEENESALEYGEEFKEDLEYVTFNLVQK
jgi:hypothetical protein